MPFYEYECESCKFYMEVMQKISDAPLAKCPSCGQKALKKLVSAPVFRLKGGGWYETDFKSEKEAKRNLAEGDKAEKTEGTPTQAKADSATDAKSGEGKAAETKTDSESTTATASKAAAKSARPARKSPVSSRKPPPARRAASKPKAKSRSARKSRR